MENDSLLVTESIYKVTAVVFQSSPLKVVPIVASNMKNITEMEFYIDLKGCSVNNKVNKKLRMIIKSTLKVFLTKSNRELSFG